MKFRREQKRQNENTKSASSELAVNSPISAMHVDGNRPKNFSSLGGLLGNQAMIQLSYAIKPSGSLAVDKINSALEQKAELNANQFLPTLRSKPVDFAGQTYNDTNQKAQQQILHPPIFSASQTSFLKHNLSGPGNPLPKSARQLYEPQLSADLSSVRIHNDSNAEKAAEQLNARAFTLGNNIVFGKGQYSPNSIAGKKVLAHELTHVVQQANGRVNPIQRIPKVTNGEYGKAVHWFMEHHVREQMANQIIPALRSSRTFMAMARFLDARVIFPTGSRSNEFEEISASGELLDANGHSIGKRSLFVYPSFAGTFFAPHGTPVPGLSSDWDTIFIQHPAISASNDEKLERYISQLAHETKHAQFANSASHAPAADAQTAIGLGITEESSVRQTEQQVLREIRRSRHLPRQAAVANPTPSQQIAQIEGGSVTADVERSFVSRPPIKTYLENFLFEFLKRPFGNNLTEDQKTSIMREIDAMALSTSVLDGAFTLRDFGEALGMFASASSPMRRSNDALSWGTFYLMEKLFGMEWTTFQNSALGVEEYFNAKEVILQRHLTILEQVGSVNYSAQIPHP